MRTIYSLLLIMMFITCMSCNKVDFSNPEAVLKSYRTISYERKDDILYRDYISSKSKEYVTKDEFIKTREIADSTLELWKNCITTISSYPIDVNNSSYRRFKVEEKTKIGSDTVYSTRYYTTINENGNWKIVWTSTLQKFASNKYMDGNYIEARKILEKVVEINPYSGEAYGLTAWCYIRDNSLSSSEWENGVVNNAKYAITLEEDNPDHYNTLAAYYGRVGNSDLAIQNWERGLKFCQNKEDKTIFLSNLAVGYTSIGNFKKAEEYIKQSLEINENDAFVWFRYGILKQLTNNYSEAITYFERAISEPKMENSLQGSLYYFYSYCCMLQERCEVAKEYINKALDIEPNNDDYQNLYRSVKLCK